MKATLEIQNLKCGGCANTIVKKLSEIEDINELHVCNETNTVAFTYKNDDTITEAKELLVKIGYPAIGEKNALSTKAKSFVSCAIGRMNN